jgi:hypothetical protein
MNICSMQGKCHHIKMYSVGCGHNVVHEPDDVCGEECETGEGVRGAKCREVTPQEEVLFRMTGKTRI